jgi:hypothetical protein
MERECGACQLCCKLLPMKEDGRNTFFARRAVIDAGLLSVREAVSTIASFPKPAGECCKHQHHRKGCAVYERRPFGCRFWNCRWLINDDMADQHRPDRSHAVIDTQPNFVMLQDNATGGLRRIEVVQIWVDPDYPDAHRHPALRAYIERRAHEGKAVLIRFNETRGIAVFAPPLTNDGQWHERHGGSCEPAHTPDDWIAAICSTGGLAQPKAASNELSGGPRRIGHRSTVSRARTVPRFAADGPLGDPIDDGVRSRGNISSTRSRSGQRSIASSRRAGGDDP